MIVEVTQEDIDKGVPYGVASCPVALALQRTIGARVAVDPTAWSLFHGMKDYPLPGDASVFIRDFDSGKPVAPFRFRTRKP